MNELPTCKLSLEVDGYIPTVVFLEHFVLFST